MTPTTDGMKAAWHVTIHESTRGTIEVRQAGVLLGRGVLPSNRHGGRILSVRTPGGERRRVVVKRVVSLPIR